jgi:hypothetical protein
MKPCNGERGLPEAEYLCNSKSCFQYTVADHLHFVIRKDGHKLLLQMDKAFIPKGVNQHVRVSLAHIEDIEFYAGLI